MVSNQMPSSHNCIFLPAAAAPYESAGHAVEEAQDLDEGHAGHAEEQTPNPSCRS